MRNAETVVSKPVLNPAILRFPRNYAFLFILEWHFCDHRRGQEIRFHHRRPCLPKGAVLARDHVIRRPTVKTWIRRSFATAFGALGAKLALSDWETLNRAIRIPLPAACLG